MKNSQLKKNFKLHIHEAQQLPIRIITKKFTTTTIIVKMLKDKIFTATRENEFYTQQNYLSKNESEIKTFLDKQKKNLVLAAQFIRNVKRSS